MIPDEVLEIYRNQIDSLDAEVINLFARRFQIVKEVGKLKKQNNIPIIQSGRWNDLLSARKDQATSQCLDPTLIENIWILIHNHSCQLEEKE